MNDNERQWYMDKIKLIEQTSEYNHDKKDIIVALIDTGIAYDHDNLKDHLWINNNDIKDNEIDDDHNGYIDDVYGYNFINDNNEVYDDNGHGTQCAGIIVSIGYI